MGRKRVAIVGSGCAGLGAAWALKDTDYEIHLFEKEQKLGGHTNTEIFKHGKYSVPVDTGFIVMNTATYPNFINFLKEAKVETVPTAMTFAVSRDHGKFEWSGKILVVIRPKSHGAE
jgi:predicted NAD/FAD-binding protein